MPFIPSNRVKASEDRGPSSPPFCFYACDAALEKTVISLQRSVWLQEIYEWHFWETFIHSTQLTLTLCILTHAAFICHLVLLSDSIHLRLIASIFPSQKPALNFCARFFCAQKGVTETYDRDITAAEDRCRVDWSLKYLTVKFCCFYALFM